MKIKTHSNTITTRQFHHVSYCADFPINFTIKKENLVGEEGGGHRPSHSVTIFVQWFNYDLCVCLVSMATFITIWITTYKRHCINKNKLTHKLLAKTFPLLFSALRLFFNLTFVSYHVFLSRKRLLPYKIQFCRRGVCVTCLQSVHSNKRDYASNGQQL